MIENNFRYNRSLVRNLVELERALSFRNSVNELARTALQTNWSFFSYAYLAMFDAMIFHAIKILDKHKDAASFWYIWNCNQKVVNAFIKIHNLSLDDVNSLSVKLKIIRDKTHFHIDKSAIFNPRAVWEEANISGNEFNKVLDNLWEVLRELYFEQFGKNFNQPIYAGEDIENIISAVLDKGFIV